MIKMRMKQQHILSWCLSLFMLCCLMAGFIRCDNKKPIKIGFAAGLTGKLSDLGISGRDAVRLAVEEINEAGGIKGRPVELIVKDDKQDSQTALKVDQELIDQGVVAVIGHMTSTMSMAVLPLMNRARLVLISPTTSTSVLSGKDDYFVRLTESNMAQAIHLARHVANVSGLKKVAVVYDLSNHQFSESLYHNFRDEFAKLGGELSTAVTFISGSGVPFASLAAELIEPRPEAVLIIAAALDAAMICQHIRRIDQDVLIIASAWSMTEEFLHHGGPAVEGVLFSQATGEESDHPRYREFKKRFYQRYVKNPNFSARLSYETAYFLFEALSRNDDPETLIRTLLNFGVYEGLTGKITIDKYGDAHRDRLIMTVHSGHYEAME